MRTLRAAFDATIGRRLLVRIWTHGVLLFAGVIAMFFIARSVMSDLDDGHILRGHPYLGTAVAERILAHAGDGAAMRDEMARAAAETPLAVTVYSPAGDLVASTVDPPLPARAPASSWTDGELAVRGTGGLVVLRSPGPPSIAWHVVMLLTAALIVAFVFVAWPLTSSIAQPIAHLRTAAARLGDGDLAVRVGSDRRDEIGDLGRAFDAMAGQIQRLRAAERELLGGVSHELRTPLARMRVVLELADGADRARVQRYLAEITADLAELEQLVDDIIVSARLDPEIARWDPAHPPLRKQRVTVDELVDAAAARFRAAAPERALEIERDDTVEVDGDPAMLRRALDNLLDNARKYSADDTRITLHVERRGAGVRIEVIDTGIGIAVADHPRVFSGFFRADPSRTRASGGVGLGLSLVRRIVEAHGGAVGFTSEVDRGSRFWFELAAT